MALELGQQRHQVMHAAVRLLRAGFEQIEELFVVSQESSDREHKVIPRFVGRFGEPGKHSGLNTFRPDLSVRSSY
jgi:hypothetical protein